MQSGKRGRDQGRNVNVHNPRTRAPPVWGDTVAGLNGCPHATDRVTSPRLATACRSCPNYNGPAGFRITSCVILTAHLLLLSCSPRARNLRYLLYSPLIAETHLCYAGGRMLPTEDELLSPAQAAERLGVGAHIFRRRAAMAIRAGETRIRQRRHKSRHDYLATEAVWREYAWPPKRTGRPTKDQPPRLPGKSDVRRPEPPHGSPAE